MLIELKLTINTKGLSLMVHQHKRVKEAPCTVFLLNEFLSLNKARIQLRSKTKHITLLQRAEIFHLQPKDSCTKFGITLYHYPTSILRFCKLKCQRTVLFGLHR